MQKLTGTFTYPHTEPALADHFPDSPIIPGTLIIHGFISVLREQTASSTEFHISKFRFKSFITPGNYEYQMEQKTYGYSCTLLSEGKKAVTGRILFSASITEKKEALKKAS